MVKLAVGVKKGQCGQIMTVLAHSSKAKCPQNAMLDFLHQIAPSAIRPLSWWSESLIWAYSMVKFSKKGFYLIFIMELCNKKYIFIGLSSSNCG